MNCPTNVSQFGKIENHVPIHPGTLNPPTGVVPIHPANCISLTSSPTDTNSTNNNITPVMINSRRYGNRACNANVNTPAAAVNRQPITTPSSTTLAPYSSRRFCKKITTSKHSRYTDVNPSSASPSSIRRLFVSGSADNNPRRRL